LVKNIYHKLALSGLGLEIIDVRVANSGLFYFFVFFFFLISFLFYFILNLGLEFSIISCVTITNCHTSVIVTQVLSQLQVT